MRCEGRLLLTFSFLVFIFVGQISLLSKPLCVTQCATVNGHVECVWAPDPNGNWDECVHPIQPNPFQPHREVRRTGDVYQHQCLLAGFERKQWKEEREYECGQICIAYFTTSK